MQSKPWARSRRGHGRCRSAPIKTTQAPLSQWAIPGRVSIRRIWSAFSRPSTPRNQVEREWGCRSAGRSSTPMGAGCGQMRTSLAAPYFSSPCPAPKESSRILFRRFAGRERCAKTPGQTLFIHRLAQVTNYPVVQGASLVNIVGIGRHEDCRDDVARTNEVSVELDPSHPRHVDVGDQAGRFGETRRYEEIGRRWKSLDGIA